MSYIMLFMEPKHYIDIKKIKSLMERQNVSVQTLAGALKVTPRTAKKFLDGANQSGMSAVKLIWLTKLFSVSADYLLGFED